MLNGLKDIRCARNLLKSSLSCGEIYENFVVDHTICMGSQLT